jgi:excisionase family DNA binding protein
MNRFKQLEFAPVPAPTQYLTLVEVGQILCVSPRVVGQYVASKGLRASKVGKRLLIARTDLDAFIQGRVVTGTAKAGLGGSFPKHPRPPHPSGGQRE